MKVCFSGMLINAFCVRHFAHYVVYEVQFNCISTDHVSGGDLGHCPHESRVANATTIASTKPTTTNAK